MEKADPNVDAIRYRDDTPDDGQSPVPVRADREHILQFFDYTHLPPHLKEVSQPFCVLAHRIVDGIASHEGAGDGYDVHPIPRNPERTVALRKLLEAKDAAVRAVLAK